MFTLGIILSSYSMRGPRTVDHAFPGDVGAGLFCFVVTV